MFVLVAGLTLMGCSFKKNKPQVTEYEQIKSRLMSGWNTFNTWNSISYVHMPEGFEIAFDLKYQAHNFSGYLQRANFIEGSDWKTPKLKALAHAWDGSYTKIEVNWEDVHVTIETAVQDGDFVAIVKPVGRLKYPSTVIVRTGILFNRPGSIHRDTDDLIKGTFSGRTIEVFPVTLPVADFAVAASTPYFAMRLDTIAAIGTGRKRTLVEVEEILKIRRDAYHFSAQQFGEGRAEVYEAITTILAWNTIYEPVKDRVLSTVSRTWNEKRGGYGLFAWDNFFMAYLSAIDNKDLAFANVIEHLNDMTEEGFVPNNSQGNGRMSWDRSQPPVGGIVTREIFKKYPETWFLEATFDKLLTWNRWWMKRRFHEGMLCWGSHKAQNPYNDKAHNNHLAAVLESGLDDSPMYDEVPFDAEKGILLLHDVGLNSLYVADCESLAEIAQILGRTVEARELKERAEMIRIQIKTLWSEEDGIFLNRRTDTDEFVKKYSPTLFYALMAGAATPQQAERMVNEYFYNPEHFWGEYIMPSISRSDPEFHKQRYWKGAIWAPMNFLTYLSFRNYPNLAQAQQDLSDKSLEIFVKEWNRMNYISENYSAFDGTGDDPRIKSHPFYSWGALMGVISFIHEGYMPKTEESLIKTNHQD
jgi:putative isomerase